MGAHSFVNDASFVTDSLLGLAPGDYAAGTTNGPVINRLGYTSCVLAVAVGAVSGSPTAWSIDVKLQHGDSPTLADAQDYAAPVTINTSNAVTEVSFNLAGAKKYVRVVATRNFTGGTSPSVGCGVVFVASPSTMK